MCVLSIKVFIQKKSGNLFKYLCGPKYSSILNCTWTYGNGLLKATSRYLHLKIYYSAPYYDLLLRFKNNYMIISIELIAKAQKMMITKNFCDIILSWGLNPKYAISKYAITRTGFLTVSGGVIWDWIKSVIKDYHIAYISWANLCTFI